jgi:hypothetical protein
MEIMDLVDFAQLFAQEDFQENFKKIIYIQKNVIVNIVNVKLKLRKEQT